jgi:hypothetical protein
MRVYRLVLVSLLVAGLVAGGCTLSGSGPKPRMCMFVGVDISGSFMNGEYFDDSIEFLAYYLYGHLHGLGELEVPDVLFVSSIGGAKVNEPKTFYPIQTFSNKSVQEIESELRKIFPKEKPNPFTDYNAFFEQVAMTVKNRKLTLRPMTIVMLSDGIPDVSRRMHPDFKSIVVKPLENLSRNVTIRLLYTTAVVGKDWQTKVPRSRVKIWTQDAEVLSMWNDPKIMMPGRPLEKQDRFFEWVQDNVDYGVRSRLIT